MLIEGKELIPEHTKNSCKWLINSKNTELHHQLKIKECKQQPTVILLIQHWKAWKGNSRTPNLLKIVSEEKAQAQPF